MQMEQMFLIDKYAICMIETINFLKLFDALIHTYTKKSDSGSYYLVCY